jgi:hypothetical protein
VSFVSSVESSDGDERSEELAEGELLKWDSELKLVVKVDFVEGAF